MAVRYSLKEIIATLPHEKNMADSPWTRWLLRPLSFPFSWLMLRLGVTPNAVTYLSAVVCLIGFALVTTGTIIAVWIGVVCFFVFGVLDCADGNMARMLKKAGPWGEWVDAFGGYTAYTTILLAMGVASERMSPGVLPGISGVVLPWVGGWALVGAMAASANLFMRVLYQGFRAIKPDPGRASISSEKKISENLGITGLLVPALAMGVATGFLAWVMTAYAVFYCGSSLVVAMRLIAKVEKETRNPT